jgi:phospholipid transport system substrate-binding protein
MSQAAKRLFHKAGALVLALLLARSPALAAPEEDTADLVRRKIDEVLSILRDPGLRGSARRARRHQKILGVANTIFDWDEMARRSLGVYWRQASASQRKRFVPLFREVLSSYYLDQMDNFAGEERITVKGSSGSKEQQVVKTVLITQSRERLPIDYFLDKGATGWRVVDVSIEGVSLVNNYRSRFRQYLVNHSLDELLEHLGRRRRA